MGHLWRCRAEDSRALQSMVDCYFLIRRVGHFCRLRKFGESVDSDLGKGVN